MSEKNRSSVFSLFRRRNNESEQTLLSLFCAFGKERGFHLVRFSIELFIPAVIHWSDLSKEHQKTKISTKKTPLENEQKKIRCLSIKKKKK